MGNKHKISISDVDKLRMYYCINSNCKKVNLNIQTQYLNFDERP